MGEEALDGEAWDRVDSDADGACREAPDAEASDGDSEDRRWKGRWGRGEKWKRK